jgi:hypothetical protein
MESDGIEILGEVPLVTRRDPLIQVQHDEAFRSGQREAFARTQAEVLGMLERAGPYDDTVTMQILVDFLSDRIKEVGNAATPTTS